VKLHDLKPAPGSRKERTRVGRGIAAGQGKTAGRGTKGQKSRAGGNLPAWFEGGQTPAHIRMPKLHGFKRRWRIEYQVVNVGRISEYAESGRFGAETGASPLTVNTEVLLSAGLISTERLPVKVLGHGDVTVKLFVAVDAFTKSAREKIEGAGGFVQATAPVVVKGETKQDRADARAAIAAEKQKATDAADAARWATPAPSATAAEATTPAADATAPVADAEEPAEEEASTADADADAGVTEAALAVEAPPADEAAAETVAEDEEPAADEEAAAGDEFVADDESADDEAAADDDGAADDESGAEEPDETPSARRRARKTTDSADE
jgi:large subunit ribosomal protein L15